MILNLAVKGRLVRQDPSDEPASELLSRVSKERQGNDRRRRARRPRADASKQTRGPSSPYPAPAGWAWSTLGALFGLRAGKNVPAGTIREAGRYPCFGGNGVRGYVESFNRDGSHPVIGRQGALCGNVKIANGRFFATEHAVVVDVFAGTSVAWAGLALQSLNLNQYATATAQPGLSVERISEVPIPVPPLAEQLRIVERVASLTALCDELEREQSARTEARSALTAASVNRVTAAKLASDLRTSLRAFADNIDVHLAPGEGDLAALNRVRQGIVDLAVQGRLTHHDSEEEPASGLLEVIAAAREKNAEEGPRRKSLNQSAFTAETMDHELPPGWARSSVGELALSSDSGWSPSCLPTVRTDDSQWAVLKVSAVTWGSFRSQEHKLLGPDLEPRPAIEVHDGDFLMSRANTSELVGRSVVVREPPPRLMLSDKLVRLKFADQVTAEYVNLVNASSATRAYYASVSSGTSASMRNITRGQILSLAVPLPPLAEQARIVRRVAELSALCDNLETQFAASRVLRGDVAASVAAHAVSGTSTPYEIADVPPVASVGTLRQ